MKSTWSLYLILFFLIFFPVLDISGHFINIPEFYIYLLFAMNIKKIVPIKTVRIFIVYTFLFFCTVVFTALIAAKPINNYDIFVLRNSAQLICLLSILYLYIQNIFKDKTAEELKGIILRCFYILSLPALVIYLERLNVFNTREIVKTLYKPQFFFLGADLFTDFRYNSVFKDFFTAVVYFIVLTASIYYFYLTAILEKSEKFKLILLIIFIYVSQLFVSRSSLLLIPINLILMTLFATKASVLISIKRLVIIMAIVIPAFVVIVNSLVSMNYIKEEWVAEGISILISQPEDNRSSSFLVMQRWNHNFFQYVVDNPKILILPNHEYDLKENSPGGLYTDGFYPQETYRYGVYGLLAYLYLVVFLCKEFFKNHRGLLIIIVSFILLNYKGGNVFFMPKNIYLYAFVMAAFLIFDIKENKKL